MKATITAAAALFAANVSAVEIYHGLENGHSDLSTPRVSANDFAGVQPSIGDSVERYRGFADGNPDLFQTMAARSAPAPDGRTST
jgi:hypothetical protein